MDYSTKWAYALAESIMLPESAFRAHVMHALASLWCDFSHSWVLLLSL